MNAREFAATIADFSRMEAIEQTKRFCWYLVKHENRNSFTVSDIERCFDDAKCPMSFYIHDVVRRLADQQPPFLRRRGTEWDLTIQAHEELNPLLGDREATVIVDDLLRSLPEKLGIEVEKAFLEEALICFRHEAFRAAIVMAWNLAYDHLCNVILQKALATFNTQLTKTFKRPPITSIAKRDDFEALKESEVLQVAKSANIISGNVHKILKAKLDRRNAAAHPSHVSITRLTAEEFITDLVENVVLKL